MEKTIIGIQTPEARIQLIVKNNKTYVIKNRKVKEINYPYRENWTTGDKIYHTLLDEICNYFLNEIIWRIKQDGSFIEINDIKRKNEHRISGKPSQHKRHKK